MTARLSLSRRSPQASLAAGAPTSRLVIGRALVFVLGMAVLPRCDSTPDEVALAELRALRESRDYFSLRERLDGLSGSDHPELLFFRATVQHAFNELDASNATLAHLLEREDLDEELLFEVRAFRVKNDARRYRYREAYETSRLILESTVPETRLEDLEDVRNTARLIEALADVPAQVAEIRAPTELRVDASRHVPLQIGEAHRSYLLDTGANLSVLMRSEAEGLGLEIRPAGVEVGTSTDVKILADVAVADFVTIGNVAYRHVVFLVLEDDHLSFPGGFRIPGIVGFPLIEAMGEVTFRSDGTIAIAGQTSRSDPQNLAFEELVPLTRVRYGEDWLICRLDTGSSSTDFYEPFYERYRSRVEALGVAESYRTGGAGGVREVPAYILPEIAIEVGGTEVRLTDRPVYKQPITEEKDNYLFCNIGIDSLAQFAEYSFDFRQMSFVLGGR
ncbi:MAG TPA: retropepsin-like aspartic protease [Vicinamibacteria bacterium]|nr:retropepsin-like aspartic protease [Vicinamibacteria bacterium]